ncbi:glyoxalase-like domain-containing protein [Coniochaeta sp. 2T2.1]|nr:glyoxalase-like domain-containing protein [Coniochaeta sp. 2T2.1]
MARQTNHAVLDHIVILVSPSFLASPPEWLTSALTVLPGGTHSDGSTFNKLVVFDDGVYLELIAFAEGIDPAKRLAHRWGRKAEGQIVDWAFTMLEDEDGKSTSEDKFAPVLERIRGVGSGFGYSDPWGMGRTRPDGVELKWAISAPSVAEGSEKLRVEGGELPFWCLDRSPRAWRVPHGEEKNRQHPSGAVGVASLSISVKGEEEVRELRKVYDAIADREGKLVAVEGVHSEYSWKVDVPFAQEGGGVQHGEVVLRKWSEDDLDLKTLSSDNVHISLKLFTKGERGRIEGAFGDRRLVVELVPLGERA